MMYKYLILVLFMLLSFSFSLGQTLELFGQKVTFGATLSEQNNNFWEEGGQIESDASYLEVYEGDNLDGWFYKKQLVTLDVNMWSNKVCSEIEDLIINLKPYNQYTIFKEVEILYEIYQTNDYYISRSSSSKSKEYTIIPVKVLENIRRTHSEYLSKLF
ncbi:MAG: hypothetical protein NTY74_14560 [Ignavibacteriae bacterium]|nr:hypothetical protein [Ignavibacteriota bacterium]